MVSGARATVHYFHQVDDPYSHLTAQCLAAFSERYDVNLVCHLVPPPDDSAAPERERLKSYGLRDAPRVARRYGLSFPSGARQPSAAQVELANCALARSLSEGRFLKDLHAIGEALWLGVVPTNASPEDRVRAKSELETGRALRDSLGHYLGGMLHFEGEWYWGIDRLHHLETRLRGEGLLRLPDAPRVAPFQDMALDGAPGRKPLLIEFWFSYRSPYSYIAASRLHRLAAHYGATVQWRFILPMIMRGLPVPAMKSNYIMLDVKREAEILGIRFGTSVDPFGAGIERALAVLHRAIALGRGAEFAESGLQGAFADGIDMATDSGLRRVALRAGLSADDIATALSDSSWRSVAEANRKALFDAGLWGAPTYRVNGMVAHWGQDRLWALEEDIKAVIATTADRIA